MFKKIIAAVLSAIICINIAPLSIFSEEYDSSVPYDQKQDAITESIDISSVVVVSPKTVKDILNQSKFSARQGHGFAAERGNDLVDKIKGKNTRIVGDNNIKNGPDRLIINREGEYIYIQDKYCASAVESIGDCFENGTFRYYYKNKPMIIEVPADQYKDAIIIMKDKIKNKQVPGVTNSEDAEKIVQKGALTYKQAVNLAKSGTVESLVYDSIKGTVTATYAFGISAVLNYTVCRMNGYDKRKSLDVAVNEGLVSGASAFAIHVISSQVSKTVLKNMLYDSSVTIVRALGPEFAKNVVRSAGKQVVKSSLYADAATIMSNNILIIAAEIVVFTLPDFIDLLRNRISPEQFLKNFAVIVAAAVGSGVGFFAGMAVGSAIAPGVGTKIGAGVGATVGGAGSAILADVIADRIVQDDAEEMYEILQNSFVQKCEDYLINEDEANRIADNLSPLLDEAFFKNMYQNNNKKTGEDHRQEYLDSFLDPLFQQEVMNREKIEQPTEEEMRELLLEQLEGVVFVH